MNENSKILEVAKEAAKKGGEIILKYFNEEVEFHKKKDNTFVSIADEESEKEIRGIILKNFPEHSIYGEEIGKTGQSNIVWHVDPLDGTSNFKNKIPFFCVSIGVEKEGNFILGVIYNPITNELFSALEGGGAFVNEKRINVNKDDISNGIFVIDASFSGNKGEIKTNLQKEIIKISPRLRMIGSNALQLTGVADGTYSSSISDHIDTYDFAAGIVIVKEAGGVVTDQLGNKPSINSKIIIASNKQETHRRIIELTKNYYKEYNENTDKGIIENYGKLRNYKVCILAGGIGSRMGDFSKTFNKALIPIQGKPSICHIIEKFPEDIEMVIIVGYKKETIIEYLKYAYPKRKLTFFEVEKHSGLGAGPGYAVLECKHLLQCPFIFFAADTLVKENVPEPNENWFGIAEVEDTSRFCSANINENNMISKIDDKIKCDNKFAFIGVAGVKDYTTFIEALENDKTLIKGEIQISNGFKSLMGLGMKGIVFTWFDAGDPNSYKHAIENYPDGEGYKGK
jgi:myo-inositol-1(or 4)-monophosphatase